MTMISPHKSVRPQFAARLRGIKELSPLVSFAYRFLKTKEAVQISGGISSLSPEASMRVASIVLVADAMIQRDKRNLSAKYKQEYDSSITLMTRECVSGGIPTESVPVIHAMLEAAYAHPDKAEDFRTLIMRSGYRDVAFLLSTVLDIPAPLMDGAL